MLIFALTGDDSGELSEGKREGKERVFLVFLFACCFSIVYQW
jgi:hypothetical protein